LIWIVGATALAAGLLVGALGLFALRAGAPALSARDVAAEIASRRGPDDLVYTYSTYLHGLPFYTGRRVDKMILWQGELEYAARDPRVHEERFGGHSGTNHIRALPLPGWACLILLFAAHFLEDQWRVTTIFKHHAPDNTLYFLWDQAIHAAIIFAVSPIGLSNGEPLVPEKWPVLGCLAVVLTHMTTVTGFFLACMVGFYSLARMGVAVGGPFYLWVGVFSLMVIAQFWSFANDLYTTEEGKRLFPLVQFGASVGAVAGSSRRPSIDRADIRTGNFTSRSGSDAATRSPARFQMA